MTHHHARLIAVAILIAASSASFAERSETVDELRARAEQGDADAQIKLGVRYYRRSMIRRRCRMAITPAPCCFATMGTETLVGTASRFARL